MTARRRLSQNQTGTLLCYPAEYSVKVNLEKLRASAAPNPLPRGPDSPPRIPHHREHGLVPLDEVTEGDPQQVMARVTGNYKRGNERTAGNNPRNR
jgi:hypothetical protein